MYKAPESSSSTQQPSSASVSSKPFALKNPAVSRLSSSLQQSHLSSSIAQQDSASSPPGASTDKYSPEDHSNEFIAQWSSSFSERDEHSVLNVFGGSSYASSSSSSCSFVSSTTGNSARGSSSSRCRRLLDTAAKSSFDASVGSGGFNSAATPQSDDNTDDFDFNRVSSSFRPRSFTHFPSTTTSSISVTSPNGGTVNAAAARRLSKSLKSKSKLSSRLSAAKLHIAANSTATSPPSTLEQRQSLPSSSLYTPPEPSPLSTSPSNPLHAASRDDASSASSCSSHSTQSASLLEPADKTPTPDNGATATSTAMTNFREAPFSAEKQERLLIFLLSRSFQDPQEMNLVCSQLVETGYLSDQALNPTIRKEIVQSFLLNTLLNGSGHTLLATQHPVNNSDGSLSSGGSKMRRSRSASSFFDSNQGYSNGGATVAHFAAHPSDLDIPALLSKTQQHQYLSTLPPFLASLPYATSRFRSDFCEPILLGKGGFGSVYRVSHRIDGREYAIKRVKFCFKNPEQLRVAYEKVIREVRTLSSMDEHSGIVRYHNAWFEPYLHDGLDTLAEEGDTNDDGDTSHTGGADWTGAGSTPDHSSGVSDEWSATGKAAAMLPLTTQQQPVIDPTYGRLYFSSPPQDGIFEMDDMDYDYDEDWGKSNSGADGEDDAESDSDEEVQVEKPARESQAASSATSRANDILQTIGAPLRSGVKFDVYDDDDDSSSSSPNSHVIGVPESPSFHDPSFMARFEKRRNISPSHTKVSRAKRTLLPPHMSATAAAHPTTDDARRNSIVCREASPPTHGTAPTHQPGIDQPHIRNVLQTAFSNGQFHMILCIQMQLCTTVTLEDWLWSSERQTQRKVDLDKVVGFMRQILDAVSHMHSMGIIHRDIKPSNIFVTKDESLKIGDFGLAKTSLETATESGEVQMTRRHMARVAGGKPSLFRQNTKYAGTQTYAAPEQIMGAAYNEKVDIFSLGIMFFEMFHPFSTRTERVHVLSDLRRGVIPTALEEKHPQEMAMIRRCISSNASERPSAQDLIAFLNKRFGSAGTIVPPSIVRELQAKDDTIREKDERIRALEEKLRLMESQSSVS